MCGIAGWIARQVDLARIQQLTDPIAHRGPDDSGAWIDAEAGIGLGHRRLSIVDLSAAGHQPMASNDGRWMIAYNGEIYNHLALRTELESRSPRSWRGHSDTETLIEAIAEWGLVGAVTKAVGMFAIAVWDRRDRTLSLARDRFGEKPLYHGWVGRDFVFASELKAIAALPGFDNPIDRQALQSYLSRNYVAAPRTIYQGLSKLPAGTILTVDADRLRDIGRGADGTDALRLERYWSYEDVVADGLANPIHDEGAALEALEASLADAIRGQAVADVPVGAFLSGGIDSSTVVALYAKYANVAPQTYTIGFEEAAFDESAHARAVAAHFGTRHHEHIVSVDEARGVIPLLPTMYDEPFADSSQIPTFLLSRFARNDVTVALSGDGGDELFGGYNRHVQVPAFWSRARRVPRPFRALAGRAGAAIPAETWNGLARVIPGASRHPNFGTKVRKTLALAGAATGVEQLYDALLDEWSEGSPVVGAERAAGGGLRAAGAPDAVRMMATDALTYLPDDILTKVDRAAMAVSLETRIPFLDHRVAAVAARIPIELKIAGGTGKRILRTLLYREAPQALFERPKAGFAVPVGEWLRGPLRDWAEDLLDPLTLRDDGYFDPAPVRARWARHLERSVDATPALWSILMFQAWRRAAETQDRPRSPTVALPPEIASSMGTR